MQITRFLKQLLLTLILLVIGALITGCAVAVDILLKRWMTPLIWRAGVQAIFLGVAMTLILFSAKGLIYRLFGGPSGRGWRVWLPLLAFWMDWIKKRE